MRKMTFPAIAAAAFFVAPALAGAQSPSPAPTPTPAPSPQEPSTAAPSSQAPMDRADRAAKGDKAKGELVKVDDAAKTITIKGADGVETVFAYSAATEVAGGREGVAGLATKAGTKVTVHFKSEAGTKTATKIEVDDKKSS